jgi:hypothetical protein
MGWISGFNKHFGVCPVCYKNNDWLNIGKVHWFVCHDHKMAWMVGANLFGNWRRESEEIWEKNDALLANYKIVEPRHPGVKLMNLKARIRSFLFSIHKDPDIPF